MIKVALRNTIFGMSLDKTTKHIEGLLPSRASPHAPKDPVNKWIKFFNTGTNPNMVIFNRADKEFKIITKFKYNKNVIKKNMYDVIMAWSNGFGEIYLVEK